MKKTLFISLTVFLTLAIYACNPDKIEEMFGDSIDLILDGGIINNKSASKIYMFDKDNISQIR